MITKFIVIALVLLILPALATADNLYKVKILGKGDATLLRKTGAEPILRTNDGFLVLCDQRAANMLSGSGLEYQKLAEDIERNLIAINHGHGPAKAQPFPLLFEEGEVRLYRVERLKELLSEARPDLIPLKTENLKIEYREPVALDLREFQPGVSLDSLISLINQDSLQSYTEQLQSFYRRWTGTDSNYASRDWIIGKLESFGYDPVVTDSFKAYYGISTPDAQNVLGYKIGVLYPEHHIIVGAHRDGLSSSPAADDNGSGAAAVLEMARVLKDIPTNVTLIFALFDAEEMGLLGSWHYANEAYPRGDSIIYMLNMDMIAYRANTDQAKIFHGADTTYSHLWIELADSLVGITGHLWGSSGGSDHYPFVQYGCPATYVEEYIFSTVYHTSQDSTVYMSFPYMTEMVKASLATAYTIGESYSPTGTLAFNYPNGVPDMLFPGLITTFEVVVSSLYDKVPMQGTGRLYYSINGGQYVDIPMAEFTPNHYRAAMPRGNCGDRIRFYLAASDTSGASYYNPSVAEPYSAMVADMEITVLEDNFETNKGWISQGDAVIGRWERGIPIGGGDQGDPPTDYDGSGKCNLTGNFSGHSHVMNGTATLISPLFDLLTGDGRIEYARWFSNCTGGNPFTHVMTVSISNDSGQNWTTAETVGPVEQAEGGWFVHSFWISDFAVPTSAMKLRFDVSNEMTSPAHNEAAVDAVLIRTYSCIPYVCGDASGNGEVNLLDVTYLINFLYKNGHSPVPVESGDANGNGIVNILDITYLINFLYKGGPDPICP